MTKQNVVFRLFFLILKKKEYFKKNVKLFYDYFRVVCRKSAE